MKLPVRRGSNRLVLVPEREIERAVARRVGAGLERRLERLGGRRARCGSHRNARRWPPRIRYFRQVGSINRGLAPRSESYSAAGRKDSRRESETFSRKQWGRSKSSRNG